MAEWYVSAGGRTHGPFSSSKLKQLADSKKITPETNVRLGADGKWVPANNVKGLFQSREFAPVAKQDGRGNRVQGSRHRTSRTGATNSETIIGSRCAHIVSILW